MKRAARDALYGGPNRPKPRVQHDKSITEFKDFEKELKRVVISHGFGGFHGEAAWRAENAGTGSFTDVVTILDWRQIIWYM